MPEIHATREIDKPRDEGFLKGGQACSMDGSLPESWYGFHHIHLLYENGHQEGTAMTATHGAMGSIITGIECTDCHLRISWAKFDRLTFDFPSCTKREGP